MHISLKHTLQFVHTKFINAISKFNELSMTYLAGNSGARKQMNIYVYQSNVYNILYMLYL